VLAILVAMTSASSPICNASISPGDHRWLSGEYAVIPILPELQVSMLKRLEGRTLSAVRPNEAKKVTGRAELSAPYFYVARAGYKGPRNTNYAIPAGIKLSADVDRSGTAYVTSFLLGPRNERRASEMAVVLTSSTPLTRVIPLCSSAE
jgi:hypothetical protein